MPARFCPWSANDRRLVDEAYDAAAETDERVLVTPSMMPSASPPAPARTDEVVSMASAMAVGSTTRLESTADVRDAAVDDREEATRAEGANATEPLAMARAAVAATVRGRRWELAIVAIAEKWHALQVGANVVSTRGYASRLFEKKDTALALISYHVSRCNDGGQFTARLR